LQQQLPPSKRCVAGLLLLLQRKAGEKKGVLHPAVMARYSFSVVLKFGVGVVEL
jgi:hypothetical protein